MRKLFILLIIMGLLYQIGFSQFSEDFSSDLNAWSGDISAFTINNDQQLQLNASESGRAIIYRETNFPPEWSMSLYLHMDFAPSTNNKVRWYIAASDQNLEGADAYFIEVGENGSDDAITLYRRQDGREELLARGEEGTMAVKPSIARIEVTYTEAKKWIVKVDYAGGFLLVDDMQSDELFGLSGNLYTGIVCSFTSSRSNSFFFDDWSLLPFMEDTTPPTLIEAKTLNENTVQLTFDELLDPALSAFTENYQLATDNRFPDEVSVVENQVILHFSALPTNKTFLINYESVADQAGNLSPLLSTEELFVSLPPEVNELLINEILFNPKSNGVDYLELINNAEKIITLNGIEIKNTQNGRSTTLDNIILFPQEIVAISENPEWVRMQYLPPDSAHIVAADLPSFNNDNGNVSILKEDSVIDFFDYEEAMHSPIISDPDGVSLERIFLNENSNDPSNWTSAASINNYGTPGYTNSAAIDRNPGREMFSLRYSTFSPNQDGEKDLLIIDHNLNKSNFVVNAKIFNDNGFLIRDLYNNKTIPASGSLIWDGLNNDMQAVPVGIYLVFMEVYHPDGETFAVKKTCVLARSLE